MTTPVLSSSRSQCAMKRKVRGEGVMQTASTGLRQPSFPWRKVPESDARSVGVIAATMIYFSTPTCSK